jgi:signal transduction histidine kinase
MKRLYVIILTVSLLCQVIAGFQFLLQYDISELPSFWYGDFYFLLAVSITLSFILFFFKGKKNIRYFLLLFRLVLIIIIGVPEGRYLEVEFSLFTSLILEIVFYIGHPGDKIFTVLVVGISLILQRPFKVWELELVDKPTTNGYISLGFYLGLIVLVANFIKHLLSKLESNENDNVRLEAAIRQLTSANVGFQEYATTIEERSASEERKRITRDIHDAVGYTMVNIMMLMEEASLIANSQEKGLIDLISQTKNQAKNGLNQTRKALRLLRAIESPKIDASHVINRIKTGFEKATGVKVTVEYGNIPSQLSEPYRSLIFQFIQEGLANSFRHGKATQITIYLWKTDSEIIITLEDNGTGSQEIIEGIGLSGMKERVEQLDGIFKSSNVKMGFQIKARIPFPMV